jgi:hypothetical protein
MSLVILWKNLTSEGNLKQQLQTSNCKPATANQQLRTSNRKPATALSSF